MNLKNAQSLAKCHRPGNPALQDPQVQKAVRMLEAMPEMKQALDAQISFDDRQARLLAGIEPAESFLKKIDDSVEDLQKGFQWSALKQPPFLAGAIAFLVLIGVLIYLWRAHLDDFKGRDSVEKIIETSHTSGAAPKMTAKNSEAGNLEDWFFSKGYENFLMLPELSPLKATGSRVFKQDAYTIAEIALEDRKADLFLIHADDFGIQVDPADQWKIFELGDTVVAARNKEETCFILTFKGTKSDMVDFLATLHK